MYPEELDDESDGEQDPGRDDRRSFDGSTHRPQPERSGQDERYPAYGGDTQPDLRQVTLLCGVAADSVGVSSMGGDKYEVH